MDVIDSCSVRFSGDDKATSACQEGARDSYLVSDIGRGSALGNGKIEAYVTGYHATNVLCGNLHVAHSPFTNSRWHFY